MAADDGEARPSEQARSPAGHPLEGASDPGPSPFPKGPQSCLVRALWISFAFLLLFGAVFVGVTLHEDVDLVGRGSEASNDSATESTVTGQGSPSSDSDPGVEGDPSPPAEGDGAAFPPIEVHVDVEAEDTEVSHQHVSSFYQLWPEPKTEGDLPLATPRLSGGTFDIVLDFEAMTVSGSFDLAYERDDGEEMLCLGSPEAFSGTARGAFEDLPMREAVTSETPPSDWGLPAEDWWPMDADGWYVGGSIPVELAMSGVAVMSCVTSDGVTTYGEVPFDETATITSWLKMTIDVHRDQGADHKTVAWADLYTTTNEAFTVKPYWNHSFAWAQAFERPMPDPLR